MRSSHSPWYEVKPFTLSPQALFSSVTAKLRAAVLAWCYLMYKYCYSDCFCYCYCLSSCSQWVNLATPDMRSFLVVLAVLAVPQEVVLAVLTALAVLAVPQEVVI